MSILKIKDVEMDVVKDVEIEKNTKDVESEEDIKKDIESEEDIKKDIKKDIELEDKDFFENDDEENCKDNIKDSAFIEINPVPKIDVAFDTESLKIQSPETMISFDKSENIMTEDSNRTKPFIQKNRRSHQTFLLGFKRPITIKHGRVPLKYFRI